MERGLMKPRNPFNEAAPAGSRFPLVALLLLQAVVAYEWINSGLTKIVRGGFASGLADNLAKNEQGAPAGLPRPLGSPDPRSSAKAEPGWLGLRFGGPVANQLSLMTSRRTPLRLDLDGAERHRAGVRLQAEEAGARVPAGGDAALSVGV